MNKGSWTELIISHVAGGAVPSDLDSRYHPLTIGKLFDVVYESLIYQVSANQIMYRDYGQLDAYTKAFKDVPILHDADRDEYYSIIPSPIINLPLNRGIRLISPMQDQKNRFWYSENNSVDVWSELESQQVMGYVSFYVEGDRVYYREMKDQFLNFGLLFKNVVPLSEFDDEDELGIPAQKSMEIFAMITEMLMKRKNEDSVEDNNSTQN
jgi:hypothetical protein